MMGRWDSGLFPLSAGECRRHWSVLDSKWWCIFGGAGRARNGEYVTLAEST